jgi:putative peptide zinc metalloprotease protein
VVVLSIMYFLNRVFEPYGLKAIGQLIALGACYGLVVQPLWQAYKFFSVPGRLGKVDRVRMWSTIGLLSVAIAAVLLVPLPSHVLCSLEVQARDAAWVYAKVAGTLDEVLVKPGDHVEKGQKLAQLSNPDIEVKIADLTGQAETYRAQLAELEAISFKEQETADRIAPVKEALSSVEHQLEQRKQDKEELTLVAPIAGTVLPPPLVPDQSQAESQLPTWSGSPLEKENLGATMLVGSKFCQIGDPQRLEARLVIDQGDVELVSKGQQVDVMLTQYAGTVYVSHIEKVSTENLKVSPAHLSSLQGGELPTKADAGGVPRPLNPMFEAVVPLPENDPKGLLRLGLVGRAKIITTPRTLASRLWRYFSRTFNFEL